MASLTLACAMRGDRDSNPPVTGGKTLPLALGPPFKYSGKMHVTHES